MAREKSELHGLSCSYSKLYTPTWVWILSLGCMVPSLISQRSESEHVVLGWIIDGARGNESSGLIFTWKLIKDGGGRSIGRQDKPVGLSLRHGAGGRTCADPQHAAVEGKERKSLFLSPPRRVALPRHGTACSFAPSAAACCVPASASTRRRVTLAAECVATASQRRQEAKGGRPFSHVWPGPPTASCSG